MKYRLSLLSLTSFSLFTACQTQNPAPLNTPSPIPSSTASAQPSPTPVVTAPQPSPQASSPAPIVTPSPEPTPEPTPVPTATPTPTPSPTPEPTPTPALTASLRVLVFDDMGSRMNNAMVRVDSNDPTLSFEAKATLENGYYVVKNIPTQKTMQVSVTAPGYTTRSRIFSLSALDSQLDIEFKGDTYAISNKPEVISTKPIYSGSISATGVIELIFSENMDKESVQRSFAIQLNIPSDNVIYNVGTRIAKPLSVRGNAADSVLDIRHFDYEWDTDRVIRLKPKYSLPIASDNRFRLILTYNDGSGSSKTGGMMDVDGHKANSANISTISGTADSSEVTEVETGPFRVGTLYKSMLPFTVLNDVPVTKVTGIGANVSARDNFFLVFDKDLFFNLTTGETVIGGANGQTASAPAGHALATAEQAAQNYRLTCNDIPVPLPATAVATFTAPNRVLVSVPEGVNILNTADKCKVNFSSLRDVSGQFIPDPEISFVVP